MNLNRGDGGLMLSTPRRGVQKLVLLIDEVNSHYIASVTKPSTLHGQLSSLAGLIRMGPDKVCSCAYEEQF